MATDLEKELATKGCGTMLPLATKLVYERLVLQQSNDSDDNEFWVVDEIIYDSLVDYLRTKTSVKFIILTRLDNIQKERNVVVTAILETWYKSRRID